YLKTLDNKLLVNATDLDFWIEATIPSTNLEEGSIAVSAKKIEEISSKFFDEELNLSFANESKVLKIGSEKIKFDLIGFPGEDFPAFEKPDLENQSPVIINRQEFLNFINVVQISASRFDLNNILGGIYIAIREEYNQALDSKEYFLDLASSDGGRLSAFSHKLSDLKESNFKHKVVIVPIKIMLDIQKILDTSIDDNLSIYFLSSQVVFKTEDRYIVTRLLEGNYPNYLELVPTGHDKRAIIDRKEFLSALDRVSVMANEITNMVKLSLSAETLKLDSNNLDFGNATQSIPVTHYQGEDIEINFNIKYLIDFLKVVDSELVTFLIHHKESPAIIKPESGAEHIYVIMPLKAG
ncbi:MAG: DNA polymerase III subunit beta, partial [Proteobacteria bacterium]|nr:DNA polymerase III subunit beta [Pseudomonadota bacterium]